jgi:hypothetical protein
MADELHQARNRFPRERLPFFNATNNIGRQMNYTEHIQLRNDLVEHLWQCHGVATLST